MKNEPFNTSVREPEAAGPAEPEDLAPFGLEGPDDAWLEQFRAADVCSTLGTLGAYVIIEEIAGGGQGVVYRARQPGTGRDVAIKRLRSAALASAGARERFEREIATAAGLRHANIVRVFGVEVVERQPLLILEWIEGRPLNAWARGAPSSKEGVRERIRAFIKVCQAVHHAHQRGIIHRDLKPSNILVDASGEPHVLDFGLATVLTTEGTEGTERTTEVGEQFVGTPIYASPEQLSDPSAIDIRTDVYSLGVILYELLTGGRPYGGGGTLAEARRVVGVSDVPRPSSRSAAVDRELDAIVLKALAREPDARYASVEALSGDLQRYLSGEPVLAHPRSRWYVLRKMMLRNRTAAALSAGIFVVAVAFGVVSTVLAARLAERQRAAARAQEDEARARHVAQRVSDFLQSTLAGAGPAQRGPDTTLIDALHEAGRRAERELAGEPEVAAEVYFTIGRTLRSLWMSEALPHLRRAVELKRQVLGDRHPQVAACLSVLGTALSNRRDPEAVAVQQEALSIRRQLYGEEHPDVAESRMRLAYALFHTPPARWDEAARLFDEALALYRRLPDAAPRDLACCLHNYGYMRYKQSRTREALPMYREALHLLRDAKDDPYYVECLYGYAFLLAYVGLYDECVATLDEAIPMVHRSYGESRTHALLHRRATAHLQLGNVLAARADAVAAIELRCRILAGESPEDDSGLSAVAMSLHRLGGDESAELDVERVVGALTSVGADTRAKLLDDIRVLAEVEGRRQPEAAEALLNGVLAITRSAGDDGRADTAEVLATMAEVQLARGDAIGAERTWRECLAVRESLDSIGRGPLAAAGGGLGEVLTAQGRYEEAEPLLIDCYEHRRNAHGDACERTRQDVERLAVLFEAWGRKESAAEYRADVAECLALKQSLAAQTSPLKP